MHHAEVLIGTYDWALEYLPVTLLKQSPDVRHLRYERMGIHDAQALIVEAQLRPVMAEKRSFLLYAEVLPQETQNALLKLFEDPPASSHFVLVIPHESILLPTLKSRLHVRAVESSENEAFYTKTFQDFCTATYAGRLAEIAQRIKAEDALWINEIVSGFKNHARKLGTPESVGTALRVLSFIKAPGSSKKMILEHIALSL